MDFFSHIEASAVLLFQNGVYKQVEVYHRGKDVYAKASGGFILLAGFRTTSHPKIKWMELKAEGVEVKDNQAPKYKG